MRMSDGIHCDSALAIALSLEECLLVDEHDDLPPMRVGSATQLLVRPKKVNGKKHMPPPLEPQFSRQRLIQRGQGANHFVDKLLAHDVDSNIAKQGINGLVARLQQIMKSCNVELREGVKVVKQIGTGGELFLT